MKTAEHVFFNELSLLPYCGHEEMHKRLMVYSEVLKRCGELGHKKVRYEYEFSALMVSENESLKDFCFKNLHNPALHTAINLMLTTLSYPYIEDESKQEKAFVEHNYHVVVNNKPCFGYGFTTAFLNDSFAVGFHSDDTWDKDRFSILVDENEECPHQLFCVSLIEHFDEPCFINWYVNTFDLSYTKRTQEGSCHLRDDHGKDVLQDFSKRLLKEDFVKEVVNSLPFNPKARDFIEKIFDDGMIYIRLTDTDQGLGLAVRTVGTNKLQTSFFAKLLQEKYSC